MTKKKNNISVNENPFNNLTDFVKLDTRRIAEVNLKEFNKNIDRFISKTGIDIEDFKNAIKKELSNQSTSNINLIDEIGKTAVNKIKEHSIDINRIESEVVNKVSNSLKELPTITDIKSEIAKATPTKGIDYRDGEDAIVDYDTISNNVSGEIFMKVVDKISSEFITKSINDTDSKIDIKNIKGLEKELNELSTKINMGSKGILSKGGAVSLSQLNDVDLKDKKDGFVLAYNKKKKQWVPVEATGGGVTTFKELTDTPADYTNSKGKFAVVNENEDGLVYSELTLEDLEKLKEIQDTAQDPTGFDRSDKTTFPVIEFCEDASTGTYKRIDQNAIPSIHTGQTTFGDGVTLLTDRMFIAYPDIHNGKTDYSYFWMGNKYVKDITDTLILPNTKGKKIVAFSGEDLVQAASVEDAIIDKTLVSALYCDGQGVFGAFGHEVHGKEWPSIIHLNNHKTLGTLYENGLDIEGLSNNNKIYSSISSGTAWDEDIKIEFREKATQPFVYKLGADGHFVWSTPDNNVGFMNGKSTQCNYFNDVSGEWELKDLELEQFVVTLFYGTNDAFEQIVKFVGQNVYDNLTVAKRNIPNEINNINSGDLMMPEYVPLYAVIVKSNGELIQVDEERLFRDERNPRGHISTIGSKLDGLLYSLTDKQQELKIEVENTNVYLDIEALGGGNILYNLNGTEYPLNCLTGDGVGGKARIEIPQGTSDEPRKTYIYAGFDYESEDIRLFSSIIIPEGSVVMLAEISIKTHIEVANGDGIIFFQRTTEAVKSKGRSIISIVQEKLRALGAKYENGIDPSFNIITNSGSEDDMNFTVTTGKVYQTSLQSFPSLDISTDGIMVANASGSGSLTKYQEINNLNLLKETSDGTAISNGKIAILTVFASMSSSNGGVNESRLFVNLPTGFYDNDADAENDVNNYAVSTIPKIASKTGFLVSKILVRYTTVDGGTWENVLRKTTNTWHSVARNITSPNYPSNYYNNTNIIQTFSKTGAERVRVHFRDFVTEANYDFVSVRNGTEAFPSSVAARRTDSRTYDGSLGAFTSVEIEGETLRLNFTSDGSVTRKGYYVSWFEYMTTVTEGSELIDLRGIQSGTNIVGGGGSGVSYHNDLLGRDATDSHPISAIIDLQTELDSKLNKSDIDDTVTAIDKVWSSDKINGLTNNYYNKNQADALYDEKADKVNVLELDNTTAFTPDTDYEPATKKYVDDNTGTDTDAIHKDVANEFSTILEKVTPHDDDLILIEDSENGGAKMKIKKSSLASGGGSDLSHKFTEVEEWIAVENLTEEKIYSISIKASEKTSGIFQFIIDGVEKTFTEDIPKLFTATSSVIMKAIDGGFDLGTDTATFVRDFSVGSEDGTPNDISWNNDGTKMYIVGNTNKKVYEYTLTTAFQVDTATFVRDFSVGSEDDQPFDISWNNDGTKMYIVGNTNKKVYEYTLTTAFQVDTATFVRDFSVGSEDDQPFDISWNNDGTKMYIVGNTNKKVYEYTLTTAFQVDTATFVRDFSVGSEDDQPFDISWNNDGTKMYIVGNTNKKVYEYTLTTAFQVDTATFVRDFSVGSEDDQPFDISWNNDGTKMYIVGNTNKKVYEYNTAGLFSGEVLAKIV